MLIKLPRNQEFGFFTLHTRGQSPKVIALQNSENTYMALGFDQSDKLSKEVWIREESKLKLWSSGHWHFSL